MPEGEHYNGNASILLEVNNEEDQNDLRECSLESATGRKQFEWLDIPFKAHTPSVHSCSHCEQINKPHFAHHKEWCRLKRVKIAESVELNRHSNNIERNIPVRKSKSPMRETTRPR